MPQNPLDRQIIDADSVEIRSEPTPETVPALPLRSGFIPLILVIRALALNLRLTTGFATVQNGQNLRTQEVVQAQG